ncbi:unnamed protein product [Clavelina lepadiformis]|uniref:ZP domain-containing protein n=1 Tax=Clavelina lepadiformis TaxID=159417 RepID=A0ABP0FRI6_CLALP
MRTSHPQRWRDLTREATAAPPLNKDSTASDSSSLCPPMLRQPPFHDDVTTQGGGYQSGGTTEESLRFQLYHAREPDASKMFVGFIIFVLVGMLGTKVDAQCTDRSVDLSSSSTLDVNLPPSCPVFNISVTRSVTGTTFSFVGTFLQTPVFGLQCSFYNGTSTSDQLLGTIGNSLAGLVELFQNSTNAFVQCVGSVTGVFVIFFTVPSSNVTSELFVDKPLIEVQSPSFPQDYPVDYVQETNLEDHLSIISDEGTGSAYYSTNVAPAPFNITGKEIKIQFASDGRFTGAGFQITFEAITTTPPAATELFCGSQGHVNISLSNQTVNDLCGNNDGYVIISATPVDDVNAVDPECRADASHPNFNLDLSKCSILKVTGDVIKAHFPLRCLSKLNKSAPIQRYVDECLNLTCEYNRTELLEAGAIVPEIKKVALDSVEQEGRFGVKIYFTKNQSYSDKLDAGAEVKVPDLVYTKVELSTPDDALHVQLKECWATPSEDPDDEGTRYDIIKDSFPANNPFETDDAIEIDRNYMEDFAAFNFKAFVWTNNEEAAIYVYCRVTICHEDVDSGCPAGPSGNSTKKRDVASPDSLLVASGPIFISKIKKKSCEESNGGCSDVCEMRNDDVMCMCYDRRSLAEDGETCQDAEKYELVAGEGDWSFLVCVIAAFVIVVGCLLVWSKKGGKSKNGFPSLI